MAADRRRQERSFGYTVADDDDGADGLPHLALDHEGPDIGVLISERGDGVSVVAVDHGAGRKQSDRAETS